MGTAKWTGIINFTMRCCKLNKFIHFTHIKVIIIIIIIIIILERSVSPFIHYFCLSHIPFVAGCGFLFVIRRNIRNSITSFHQSYRLHCMSDSFFHFRSCIRSSLFYQTKIQILHSVNLTWMRIMQNRSNEWIALVFNSLYLIPKSEEKKLIKCHKCCCCCRCGCTLIHPLCNMKYICMYFYFIIECHSKTYKNLTWTSNT